MQEEGAQDSGRRWPGWWAFGGMLEHTPVVCDKLIRRWGQETEQQEVCDCLVVYANKSLDFDDSERMRTERDKPLHGRQHK